MILWLLFINLTWAQTLEEQILEDPMVSLYCKEMIAERNDKITVKQKLNELLQRSQKLRKAAPTNKKLAALKLDLSQKQIEMDLQSTVIRIREMEENIVRGGCPGINL
ncbi:MAG: hypothetical protein JNM93_13930 [Bacteriovoracaceae bacterium]|nr:hypothetical protein [Bacteriovoracaceae bacterium]